ncbi:MAG TPA: hypothetical protein VMB21_02265 [Candidatus Limnocylindria bacterium]|nr:hypothetical protein [Candidatus Limnocylindria bacterium]
MNRFRHRCLRLGAMAEAGLKRFWEAGVRLVLSKAQIDRRSSVRFMALQRAEQESERLDRLRNPANYRGK